MLNTGNGNKAEGSQKVTRYVAAFVVMWFTQGCIMVPLSEHPKFNGIDATDMVGGADTRSPIRIGVTTRNEIEGMLGQPRWGTHAGFAIGYETVVRASRHYGAFVMTGPKAIFPFHHPYVPAYHCAFFEFDEDAILRQFAHRRQWGWIEQETQALWAEFIKDVPDVDDPARTSKPPSFSGN